MKHKEPIKISRRKLLGSASKALGAVAIGPSLLSMSQPVSASLAELGDLNEPDDLGIRLPDGFTSRLVAASGRRIQKDRWWRRTEYRWHNYPDGGATFPTDDGGWIYVSNCENLSIFGGGASAVRFLPDGIVDDAYRILGGTNVNCAGGATPWGTWLSCEEKGYGGVYECDPTGERDAVIRPALGFFKHEAVAVDTLFGNLYLTEDESDGRLYRYVPDGTNGAGNLNLNAGMLQVAVLNNQGSVDWLEVPNATPQDDETPTRLQVPQSTAFNGGEGIWYAEGYVYFTTKGDNRVWRLDTSLDELEIIYDAATSSNPILTGVDNVTVSANGDILVAEDGGDMQIVVIDDQNNVAPLLQVVGQEGSEITGPAFSPDGTRLYFSSQRGNAVSGNGSGIGLTYEVRGPFNEFLVIQ